MRANPARTRTIAVPATSPTAKPSTRQRLISGMGRAVARHGLRNTTVEHIVQTAGLSRRTFYQYFSDQEAALLAVYEQIVAELLAQVRAGVEAQEDPIARLHGGIDAYLDFHVQGGRLVAEVQAEAAHPASPLWQTRRATLDALVGFIDGEVRQAIDIAVDPQVYRLLFSGLEAQVLDARRGGPLAPDARAELAALIKPLLLCTLMGAQHLPKAR